MYHEKQTGITDLRLLIAAILVVAALVLCIGLYGMRADSGEEAETAIRETILRTASQCYAIEGKYPDSMEYLETNYGLRVNSEDYYIVYEVFAENVAPTVRVVGKQ